MKYVYVPDEENIKHSPIRRFTHTHTHTQTEVRRAMRQVNKNRCADTQGIVAEFFKSGGYQVRAEIAKILNLLLASGSTVPERWEDGHDKSYFESL